MSNTIINPKPCSDNCGMRIYWNNQENAYSRYLQRLGIIVQIEQIVRSMEDVVKYLIETYKKENKKK